MRVAPTATTGTRHRPGITLIEVLLGLAIFLLALVPISRLVGMGTDSALEAALQSDGMRLAASKMAEVEAGVVSAVGGGSGTFEDEPAWSWEVQSSPTAIPNLYAITVTVSHDFRGQPMTVSLWQMIVDPATMGTAAAIAKPEATGGAP